MQLPYSSIVTDNTPPVTYLNTSSCYLTNPISSSTLYSNGSLAVDKSAFDSVATGSVHSLPFPSSSSIFFTHPDEKDMFAFTSCLQLYHLWFLLFCINRRNCTHSSLGIRFQNIRKNLILKP